MRTPHCPTSSAHGEDSADSLSAPATRELWKMLSSPREKTCTFVVNDCHAQAKRAVRTFSHECYGSRGIIIITAWSRCGQIRGFHCLLLTLSQKQRCWELQSSCGTFWDFVSLSWQGHGGLKKKSVPTTVCQSSQQTQRRRSIIQPHRSTYNSQGPVFFCFFFKVSFLLSWNRVAFAAGFRSWCTHLTTWQTNWPPQSDSTAAEVSAIIRLSRWLTGENKRQMRGEVPSAVTNLSSPSSVSTDFKLTKIQMSTCEATTGLPS